MIEKIIKPALDAANRVNHMKTTLHLAPINGGAFNCLPARSVELENDCILCNHITLPWDFNPHGVRLWVIGNEFGALGAVWASHEQDAFDELVNANLGAALLIDESDADEESPRLGNAGEPANLDNAWIQAVQWDLARDCQTLCRFAEARGNNQDTLDN